MKKRINIVILLLVLVLATVAVLIYFLENRNAMGQKFVDPDITDQYSNTSEGGTEAPLAGNQGGRSDSANISGPSNDQNSMSTGTPGISGTSDNQSGISAGTSVGPLDGLSDNGDHSIAANATVSLINEKGTNAFERIMVPEGFERVSLEEGTFGEYLRSFPLKPHGSRVRYYSGGIKPWDVHVAVLDIDVGDRDLQQCADAAIRLRAEYLYSKELYDMIHFNFTNGFNAEYEKWIAGYRIKVSGNQASWVGQGSKGTDYQSFRRYLDMVFAYAGTLSLSKEMENIDLIDLMPGDVFLKGGSPGHCVIILDMAKNPETGEKIFIAAQSYMPAQEIHILKNPSNDDGNPWYTLDFVDELVTPEWTFSKDQIYRFRN